MKKYICLILVLVTFFGFSQPNETSKYIIVPMKFSCQKSDGQYDLNQLAKKYFVSKGFTVFFDSEKLPQNINENRCLVYYVDVLEDNSMFMTKLTVDVKNCQGNSIAVSQEGKSREKDFKSAYNLAFRDAVSNFDLTPLNENSNPNRVEVIELTKEELKISSPTKTEIIENKNQLFAQPTATGFQLVDSTPKIVFKLTKTSMADSYMAIRDGVNGMIYKKNNDWFFDYYVNEVLKTEKLEIKF